jgi:hypothetical protein
MERTTTDLIRAAAALVDAWRADAAEGDMETIHELIEQLASTIPLERNAFVTERFSVALHEITEVSRLAWQAADAIGSLTEAMSGIRQSLAVIQEEVQSGVRIRSHTSRPPGRPMTLPPPVDMNG